MYVVPLCNFSYTCSLINCKHKYKIKKLCTFYQKDSTSVLNSQLQRHSLECIPHFKLTKLTIKIPIFKMDFKLPNATFRSAFTGSIAWRAALAILFLLRGWFLGFSPYSAWQHVAPIKVKLGWKEPPCSLPKFTLIGFRCGFMPPKPLKFGILPI